MRVMIAKVLYISSWSNLQNLQTLSCHRHLSCSCHDLMSNSRNIWLCIYLLHLHLKLFDNMSIALKLIVASSELIISAKLLRFYSRCYLMYNEDWENLSIEDQRLKLRWRDQLIDKCKDELISQINNNNERRWLLMMRWHWRWCSFVLKNFSSDDSSCDVDCLFEWQQEFWHIWQHVSIELIYCYCQ